MRILSTAAASADGEAYFTQFETRGTYRPVHVDIAGSGTVSVQGRAAPDLDWVELHEFTATGAEMVAAMREVRAVVSGGGGAVEVEYDG